MSFPNGKKRGKTKSVIVSERDPNYHYLALVGHQLTGTGRGMEVSLCFFVHPSLIGMKVNCKGTLYSIKTVKIRMPSGTLKGVQ